MEGVGGSNPPRSTTRPQRTSPSEPDYSTRTKVFVSVCASVPPIAAMSTVVVSAYPKVPSPVMIVHSKRVVRATSAR